MNNFQTVLKSLRLANNMTQEELSKILKISRSTVGMYEKGLRQPDYETLELIADYFNVDIDYLLGRTTKTTYIPIPGDTFEHIHKLSIQRVPLLGAVAAGQPIMADEDFECYIEVGAKIQCDFCLRVKGDSMVNARIHDGDIVFVRQQAMVSNGEIAVVVIDNEATLKRVFYYAEQAKLILQAENPQYEPFVFVGDELENIRIIGKAIAFQSDVK